ncbi:MAG: hypothetical protein JWO07_240 [Candidatus Saccharibacteria bacterium]|nr:hypothetical protein [Candidatus Saccharibacteria bacterium]
MSQFIFDSYSFDEVTHDATFRYRFDDGRSFQEIFHFDSVTDSYNHDVLDRALHFAHLLVGSSYFKTFPTRDVSAGNIDEWQAEFLNSVYQEGMSQYAYENGLTRDDLAQFSATGSSESAVDYSGEGIITLQSGGKDSLLLASMLKDAGIGFDALYISSGPSHPSMLDSITDKLMVIHRTIDRPALKHASEDGAKNGHIPITYVVMAVALIQAVLTGKQAILAAIGHEGEEPHAAIGDLSVTHQWSKTWSAEQQFAEYVRRYISPDLHIGSPLRRYSELRIAELFADKAWAQYGHSFSSCNRANYKQGDDNSLLTWCGECSKCANSYLLFAPFVAPGELKSLFNGQDLFVKPLLTETFKGLLGIDGVPKPFECIGEIDELRVAYHMKREGYENLPFDVPEATFNYKQEFPVQPWASELI